MNVFLKGSNNVAEQCRLLPFPSEEDLEKFLWKHPELLEDVFLIQRQVRGGGKAGIPDIIGINSDEDVCVIEIKNVRVTASILPQILEYAIWAQNNPDSIKNMWLESKHQSTDFAPTWENYSVRVMVVAPSIDASVLQSAGLLNVPLDLFEVNRYQIEDKEIVAVNRLEATPATRARPAQGIAEYDRSFYEKNYNKDSVDHFFRCIAAVESIVQEQGWPLELKFNKGYAVFKSGNSQAFGIHWHGTKSFGIFFKLTETEATSFTNNDVKMHRYDQNFKEAIYRVEPGHTKIPAFLPLMQACVAKLIG